MGLARKAATCALFAIVAAATGSLHAQPPAGSAPRRIALALAPSTAPDPIGPTRKAWAAEFAKEGLVDGRDIEIVVHRARSFDQSEWAALSKAVVDTRPDILVTVWLGMVPPLARHAREIPIVANVAEELLDIDESPIQGRPGKNLTGVLFVTSELFGLQTQLLKQLRPRAARLIEVGGAAERIQGQPGWKRRWLDRKAGIASKQGMQLTVLAPDFDVTAKALLASLRDARPDVALVSCVPATRGREFWGELARMGIAALANCRDAAKDGALIGSWEESSPVDLVRIAAKILRGTPVSGLPMERPREFGLAINLRTAKALGLSVPPSVLVRATEVFE